MRMIKTKPEDRPGMRDILEDAYFDCKETGSAKVGDDTSDAGDPESDGAL